MQCFGLAGTMDGEHSPPVGDTVNDTYPLGSVAQFAYLQGCGYLFPGWQITWCYFCNSRCLFLKLSLRLYYLPPPFRSLSNSLFPNHNSRFYCKKENFYLLLPWLGTPLATSESVPSSPSQHAIKRILLNPFTFTRRTSVI